jgi:hypothetical protein
MWELTKSVGNQGQSGAIRTLNALNDRLPLGAPDAQQNESRDELREAVGGLSELTPAEAEDEWRRLEAKFGCLG